MKFIKLKRAHNGCPKGSVVEVDDPRGARMIKDGLGVETRKPKPPTKT